MRGRQFESQIKFWFKYQLMRVYTTDQQRNVISKFLTNWHKKRGYEDELKAYIIVNVIIPILEYNQKDGTMNALMGNIDYENDEDLGWFSLLPFYDDS